MKKSLSSILSALIFSIVFSPNPCEAGTVMALVDLGDRTYDPNTGLEWLDLHLTAGQSYDSVLGGWGGFTTTGGFRFATRSEIVRLFTNAGATSFGPPSGPINEANLQAGTLTLSLLGTTASGVVNRSWMLYDPSTETLPEPGLIPASVFGVTVMRAGYPPEGVFSVPGLFPTHSYASPEIASALVKVVPEPPQAALLSAGLAVACATRRRRCH